MALTSATFSGATDATYTTAALDSATTYYQVIVSASSASGCDDATSAD